MRKRELECSCCGQYAGHWVQHWNRDKGYGICVPCIENIKVRHPYENIESSYGKENVNYGL